MRARLTMKLMGIVVMLVLTVVSARSCSSGHSPSPLDPATLTRNGINGLCANQQAAAEAAGQDGSSSLSVPSDAAGLSGSGLSGSGLSGSGLSGLAAAAGMPSGSLACPTATTTPGG